MHFLVMKKNPLFFVLGHNLLLISPHTQNSCTFTNAVFIHTLSHYVTYTGTRVSAIKQFETRSVLPLRFNFPLEYVITRVKANQKGMKFNDTC
jgi:hypothetical protein